MAQWADTTFVTQSTVRIYRGPDDFRDHSPSRDDAKRYHLRGHDRAHLGALLIPGLDITCIQATGEHRETMAISYTSGEGQNRRLRHLMDSLLRRRRQNAGSAPPEPAGPATDCLFCQVDDPTINKILCENELFYARFDNYPANPGHIEIVPRRHVVSFFELDDHEVLSAYTLMRTARDLIDEKYFPEAYTIGINDGKAAGRTIDHLHIHLIPRHHGDVEDPRGGIRRAAPNSDPDAWQ